MKTIENEGIVYYVGQSAKENESLYTKVPKTAIWFHLDDGPSAHVYAVSTKKLTKKQLKVGAVLVRQYSKGQGKVIYLTRSKLKSLGGGTVEMLCDPKIA